MDEYLPPIVTKLKADLSDLVAGLAEARMMVRDFAAGSHKELVDSMTDAGRDGGAIFGNEFKKSAESMLRGVEHQIGDGLTDQSGRLGSRAGTEGGKGFFSSFLGFITSHPLALLIVASLPLLGPLIGGLLATAFTFAFIGLGAVILHNQAPIIAAATELKDNTVAVFKDAAAPMLTPLVNALKIFTAGMKAMGPAFKEIFAELAPIIEPLAHNIVEFMQALLPGLKEMLGHTEIVKAFGSGLGGVGAGLGEIFHQIAAHGPEIARFMTDFMIALANTLRWLGIFVGYLSVTYDSIHKGSVAASKGIAAAFGWIKNTIMAVGNWISSTADKIGKWFTDLYDKVVGFFTKSETAVESWFTKTVGWFEALPGRIWTAVSAIPGLLGRAAVAAFDAFFYWTAFGIARLVQYWAAAPGLILAAIGAGWTLVVAGFHAFVDQIVHAWDVVQELPGKVGAWFEQLGHRLADWATGTLIPWVAQTVKDFISWWWSLPERAGEAFASFIVKAKAWFAGAGTWLWQAGKDLLMGLIHGVEDSVDWAVSVVKRAVGKIKDGVKDALGIKSPSTVFAEIGRYSMQGYIQGILGERNNLSNVWGQMPMPGLATGGAGSSAAMAASVAPSSRGGNGFGGAMLEATFNLDGNTLMTALIPVAQRVKARTGTTGLG